MIGWKLLRCCACNRSINVLKSQTLWKLPSLNRPISRNLYEGFIGKNASNKTVAKLKLKDGVRNESELIYRAEYDKYFQGAYVCVMISSITFPAWVMFLGFRSDFKLPIRVLHDFQLSSVFEIVLLVSMLGVLGIASFIILSRYALRIYQNPGDTYTAVFHNVALRTIHQHFKRGEVHAIPEQDLLPNQISRYKIKGRKTIIHEDKFRRPSDFIYMLGFKVNKDDIDVHDENC
ncbi:uncharacterized protein LOC111051103 [Nilaparvata lugens]|uniref:uncharacterized protein LOC111051103 n=1 Tax=Nilaparvata lugens TaxID=108931 RepID=UPI00193DB3F1|nr:uncharacterized protein LOC111051103 [Nilaparvata lugens]